MSTAQSRLDILINAKNGASPQVKQLTGELKSMDAAAGEASKGLNGLLLAGGVAGFAALAAGAAAAAVELTELGNHALRLEQAFNRLASGAGQVPEQMLAAMKEASRGTISETDLMLNANKAMLLGVADTGEELGTLLTIAGERAKAMGITTGQAFGDLVTAIGRQSKEIVDNLGITFTLEQAYKSYAETLGTTADKLDDAQKKQAFLNEVMRQSQSDLDAAKAATDDTTIGVDKLKVAWQELRTELGKEIAPQINQTANEASGALGWVTQFLFGDEGSMDRGVAAMRSAIAVTRAELASGFTNDSHTAMVEEKLRAQTAALAEMTDANQRAKFETGEVEAAFNRVAGASGTASAGFASVGLSADAAKERLAALKAQADATAQAIDQIKGRALGALDAAASSAVSIMGSSEVSRIYAEQKKRLDAQIVTLEKYGYTTDELKFKSQELAEKAALPFTSAVEAANEADRASKSYAKTLSGDVTDAAGEAEQAFNDLRGKVQGVLSGALNTGVASGASLLESMGLRSDAINEDARRLADVAVKGWESPWADYFRTKFPQLFDDMYFGGDNIKAIAAQQLKDFEDGLNPALIDKERAKDRIRRMLLGEANMAELALEIANELAAEMGVPLQQALATAQGTLGVGGSTGAGTEAAQTFQDGALQGIEERNGGGAMVDNFISQARANYAKLKTAGIDAGRQWGAGFMETVGESVPPALVDLLTNLVTPGVMAKIAQQGTLTGATP